jgi:hypothetical protein
MRNARMKAEIQTMLDIEHRRDARHAAHHQGEIGSVHGTVTDLSRSGCRVLTEIALLPESVVWIKVGGHGPFMARVVWYDGMAAGCEFSGKLHPDLVQELLGA